MVGHRHKGVFFPEEAPVLAHKTQPVHVRIHADAQVARLGRDGVRQIHEVFGQGLRVVGKMSCGVAMHRHNVHIERLKKKGHRQPARGVHRIHGHFQAGRTDGVGVDELQAQHVVHVLLQPRVVVGGGAGVVHVGKRQGRLGQIQHAFSRILGQEFAMLVQQLQGVPLFGVVGGGQNQPAIGLQPWHGQFHRGGGAQSQVDHVDALGIQGTAHNVSDPRPTDPGVAPHHHDRLALGSEVLLKNPSAISAGELDHI